MHVNHKDRGRELIVLPVTFNTFPQKQLLSQPPHNQNTTCKRSWMCVYRFTTIFSQCRMCNPEHKYTHSKRRALGIVLRRARGWRRATPSRVGELSIGWAWDLHADAPHPNNYSVSAVCWERLLLGIC